jgi:hypothetical protein
MKSLKDEKDRLYKLKKENSNVNYDNYIYPIEDELFTHETNLIFIRKNKNDIIAKIVENLSFNVYPNELIPIAIKETKEKVGYVRPTNEKAEKRDRASLINDLTKLYVIIKQTFIPFFRDDKTNTNIRNSISVFED